MSDPDQELRKAVALFRYGLIADVLRLPPGSREIRRTLHEKAQRTYTIPGTRRTRVALETMRDWLSVYRTGGFEALYPKTRADRGRPRRMPPEVAELLVSLKTEQPALSVKALIDAARKRGVDHPLAPSTVHRLLSGEGLLDKRPGEPVATDRRRFAFRDAGELWMSDVMHGPKVSDGRRRRKTFLIAFIDDATRVIPFAAFAFAENTTAFLPVFKHAIARRGLPARLYVDNGANFRSQQLALVCAKLGIALIHARPYQPAGKGKIERWFRTVRAAWLSHLTAEATTDLDTLNRTLWAWVEGEYHQSPHRGLDGRTPLDQWALAGHDVRYHTAPPSWTGHRRTPGTLAHAPGAPTSGTQSRRHATARHRSSPQRASDGAISPPRLLVAHRITNPAFENNAVARSTTAPGTPYHRGWHALPQALVRRTTRNPRLRRVGRPHHQIQPLKTMRLHALPLPLARRTTTGGTPYHSRWQAVPQKIRA